MAAPPGRVSRRHVRQQAADHAVGVEVPLGICGRAALSAARGDLATARCLLDEVVEAVPDFPVVGEVILRRWLHDSHVDAIADLLQPLDIGWFRAPAIGIVRG